MAVKKVKAFWVIADVEGRQTPVSFGGDGGFMMTVYISDNGRVVDALSVVAESFSDGELRLYVEPNDSVKYQRYTTGRSKRGFRLTSKK